MGLFTFFAFSLTSFKMIESVQGPLQVSLCSPKGLLSRLLLMARPWHLQKKLFLHAFNLFCLENNFDWCSLLLMAGFWYVRLCCKTGIQVYDQ